MVTSSSRNCCLKWVLTLGLVLLIVCQGTVPGILAQRAESSSSINQFVWTTDLHASGFPQGKQDIRQLEEFRRYGSLFFLNEVIIVASFVTREITNGKSGPKNTEPILPFKLHALLIDAATGKPIRMLEWSAEDSNVGVFHGMDGNLILFSMGDISLISPEGKTLVDLTPPKPDIRHEAVQRIWISPSGTTMLIFEVGNNVTVYCDWVDLSARSWTRQKCDLPPDASISDNEVVYSKYANAVPKHQEVYIGALGKTFDKIYEISTDEVSPEFMTNETILLSSNEELVVVNREGNVQGRTKILSYPDFVVPLTRPLRFSLNGEDIAVATMNSNIRVDSSVPPEHILVYDIPMRKWFYAFDNSGKWFKRNSQFALSPSGKKLVVEEGGMIRFFSLPKP